MCDPEDIDNDDVDDGEGDDRLTYSELVDYLERIARDRDPPNRS